MRVAFLTGSLESGKDGVGDYTRLLAQECVRAGAAVQAIALADRHVERPWSSGAADPVRILRLPPRAAWGSRVADAEAAIRSFAPDWVSLQFVPFSYQRWGVARGLIGALPRLIGAARLHLMLHEIWIGPTGSWRRRLMSAAQRHYVRRLCARPDTMIHTSNDAYRQMLAEHGVLAALLPLFGNVPVSDGDAWAWLGPQLAAAGCDASSHREDWWLFVFFGALHPVWPPEPLFSRLRDAAAAAGKRVALLSVGRLAGGEAHWQAIEASYGAAMPMLRLGEQPAERVSAVLNSVDFGIATSPLGLLGKSGSVAAMLEHGLPVIVNREDGPAAAAAADGGDRQVIRMDARFAERLVKAVRGEAGSRLPRVASRFLGDLAGAATRGRTGGRVVEVA